MLRLRFFLPAVVITAFHLQTGHAEEDWGLCRTPAIVFEEVEDIDTAETRVEAQTLNSDDSEIIHLTGDVSVLRASQKISADELVMEKTAERIQASGNVLFEDSNFRIDSPRIEIDNQNNQALFEQPRFEMYDRHARGRASQITRIDEYRSEFQNLLYTSCDPGDRDWHLRADEMRIDDQSGRGTAVHTTLYFQDLPFIYLPYFQFPIDDRRMSGLLSPGIGYSETKGGNLRLPVYWNIAPNYDMTTTPSWFSRHGLQLNTENRYLFESGRGRVDLSYLDDEEFGDTRWFQRWRHVSDLAYGVNAEMVLIDVSDGDIFDDFGKIAPEYNDTRHLDRHVSFKRKDKVWDAGLSWQNFHSLDQTSRVTSRPYNRLPRLTLGASPEPTASGFETPTSIEWVEFDREDSITGSRTHLVTSLKWNASEAWYFFEPELQLAFTDYRLDNNPAGNSINRALPTLGIDTGLIFERVAGSQNQWLQTLEPRLYFLKTPFEDQDDIPDFDTSPKPGSYGNLFGNNRFNGADRIGDADQVTLGLGSRLHDNDSGDQLMHLRAGQIFYSEDRRVDLKGVRDEAPKSDLIAELDARPNQRVRLAARMIYGQEQDEVTDRDLSIGYADGEFAANFGYYFEQEELEQALVSAAYPINERWTVVAKHHRSLLFGQTVENLLGFNYESCCWGIKILASQSRDEVDDFAEMDNSIYFELTLKGLSQAGQDIDTQLRAAIPGYAPGF